MASLLSWPFFLSAVLAVYAFPLWHVQWVGSIIYFFFLRPLLPFTEPDMLFAPLVRLKHCSPFAFDLNRHKSNSTYFIDVDICIAELVPRLTAKSFNLRRKSGKWAFPRLGAVGGVFLKEISPFQRYQMSSRFVAWDEKWVYIVTRFETPDEEVKAGKPRRTFAILVSKGVYKEGRNTVQPRTILEESELLPAMDDVTSSPADFQRDEKKGMQGGGENEEKEEGEHRMHVDKEDSSISWTKERIETERQKGLQLIKALFAGERPPDEDWSMYGKMSSIW